MKDAVHDFMIEILKELVVSKVFDKKDLSGIYEAKEVVELTFRRLDELFAKKEEPRIESNR